MSALQAPGDEVLAFAHIGDLHLTDAKQPNFTDYLAIAAQIDIELGEALDFVFVPGDNADNGLPSQYALVAAGLRLMRRPVHLISGDHDMEQGSLDALYAGLPVPRLPIAKTIRGHRCLFLDISGPGKGGPDFRVGPDQTAWLERELRAATHNRQTPLLFMHTYPDDLKGDGETAAINRLIDTHGVALVDMGHTHYNELANDGRTIFSATRSTGQIEEGPVGYSITTLDKGIVSWRFKLLDEPFPFVMITAPADHRLLRHADQVVGDQCEVRAVVFGSRPLERIECSVDDGPWQPMHRAEDSRVWRARIATPDGDRPQLTVRAVDETGRPGQHAIYLATRDFQMPERPRRGSDAASVGAWIENGIYGTQLGPNRNAKPPR